MDVEPVGGPFDGETVCIPLKAETIHGPKELAETYDEATMRVISAAVKHQPTTHHSTPHEVLFLYPKMITILNIKERHPPSKRGGVPEPTRARPHRTPCHLRRRGRTGHSPI